MPNADTMLWGYERMVEANRGADPFKEHRREKAMRAMAALRAAFEAKLPEPKHVRLPSGKVIEVVYL